MDYKKAYKRIYNKASDSIKSCGYFIDSETTRFLQKKNGKIGKEISMRDFKAGKHKLHPNGGSTKVEILIPRSGGVKEVSYTGKSVCSVDDSFEKKEGYSYAFWRCYEEFLNDR